MGQLAAEQNRARLLQFNICGMGVTAQNNYHKADMIKGGGKIKSM